MNDELLLLASIVLRVSWTLAHGYGLRVALGNWRDAHDDLVVAIHGRDVRPGVVATAMAAATDAAKICVIFGCNVMVGIIALLSGPPITTQASPAVGIFTGTLFFVAALQLISVSKSQERWRQETLRRKS